MTIDEFRIEMACHRQRADNEAKARKDSYVTLERPHALYLSCDGTERRMADQVLNEWALSEDDSLRFDALALIDELKVGTAAPAVRTLAESPGSSAHYESKNASDPSWLDCLRESELSRYPGGRTDTVAVGRTGLAIGFHCAGRRE